MKNRKNFITLDTNSALALMQEIYNDIVEQKNRADLITKKMLSFMKEAEDMSVLGPVIKEQQKILNDCLEKKISLVKLQGILLKQTSNGKATEGFSKLTFTDEDNAILEKLLKIKGDEEDDGLKDGKYKMDE